MVDGLLIAVRFGLYLSLTVGFGLAAFGLYNPAGAAVPALRGTLLAIVGSALLLSLAWLVLMAGAMAGTGMIPDLAAVGALLSTAGTGTAWQVRALALLVALGSLGALPLSRGVLAGTVFASALALDSLAWTGHGAAGEGTGGRVQLASDLLHLLASGVWLGALVGLILLLWTGRSADVQPRLAHRALSDFGAVGTGVVAIMLVTGLFNAWRLVGPDQVGGLAHGLYGRLLLAKLALFGAMLLLAAANRWRLTPALNRALAAGGVGRAVGALRAALAAETAAAILILGLVAWLGTLEPPIAAASRG